MTDNITNANAGELPGLLAEVDPGDPETTKAKLRADHDNDAIALRLGKAFLLGRVHAFEVNASAFDPQQKPPFDTVDECNIYAGGYQYDFENQPTDLIEHFIKEHDAASEKRLEETALSAKELSALGEEIDREGLTLERLSRRVDLRSHILMSSLNNLVERANYQDMRLALTQRMEAPGSTMPQNLIDRITEQFGEAARRRPPAR